MRHNDGVFVRPSVLGESKQTTVTGCGDPGTQEGFVALSAEAASPGCQPLCCSHFLHSALNHSPEYLPNPNASLLLSLVATVGVHKMYVALNE